jgi:hypothetical protein
MNERQSLIARTLADPAQYKLTMYVIFGSILAVGIAIGFSIAFIYTGLWRLLQ